VYQRKQQKEGGEDLRKKKNEVEETKVTSTRYEDDKDTRRKVRDVSNNRGVN